MLSRFNRSSFDLMRLPPRADAFFFKFPTCSFKACPRFRVKRIGNHSLESHTFSYPSGCPVKKTTGIEGAITCKPYYFARYSVVTVSIRRPRNYCYCPQLSILIYGPDPEVI